MQYSDLVQQIGVWCQQEQADPSFVIATPSFITAAELRCFRELDLSASSGQTQTLQTTALSRFVKLDAITGQAMSDGTPLYQQFPKVVRSVAARVGNRWIPFQLVSLNFLDAAWPDHTQAAAPTLGMAYYVALDDRTLLLAPVPDTVYPLRIDGQWQPATMSAANPSSWLGDNFPDLLLAGVIAEAFRYQRDFGAASMDPQALPAWEARFADALRGAKKEETLRQGLGPSAQPYAPAPLVHPLPPPPTGA